METFKLRSLIALCFTFAIISQAKAVTLDGNDQIVYYNFRFWVADFDSLFTRCAVQLIPIKVTARGYVVFNKQVNANQFLNFLKHHPDSVYYHADSIMVSNLGKVHIGYLQDAKWMLRYMQEYGFQLQEDTAPRVWLKYYGAIGCNSIDHRNANGIWVNEPKDCRFDNTHEFLDKIGRNEWIDSAYVNINSRDLLLRGKGSDFYIRITDYPVKISHSVIESLELSPPPPDKNQQLLSGDRLVKGCLRLVRNSIGSVHLNSLTYNDSVVLIDNASTGTSGEDFIASNCKFNAPVKAASDYKNYLLFEFRKKMFIDSVVSWYYKMKYIFMFCQSEAPFHFNCNKYLRTHNCMFKGHVSFDTYADDGNYWADDGSCFTNAVIIPLRNSGKGYTLLQNTQFMGDVHCRLDNGILYTPSDTDISYTSFSNADFHVGSRLLLLSTNADFFIEKAGVSLESLQNLNFGFDTYKSGRNPWIEPTGFPDSTLNGFYGSKTEAMNYMQFINQWKKYVKGAEGDEKQKAELLDRFDYMISVNNTLAGFYTSGLEAKWQLISGLFLWATVNFGYKGYLNFGLFMFLTGLLFSAWLYRGFNKPVIFYFLRNGNLQEPIEVSMEQEKFRVQRNNRFTNWLKSLWLTFSVMLNPRFPMRYFHFAPKMLHSVYVIWITGKVMLLLFLIYILSKTEIVSLFL